MCIENVSYGLAKHLGGGWLEASGVEGPLLLLALEGLPATGVPGLTSE